MNRLGNDDGDDYRDGRRHADDHAHSAKQERRSGHEEITSKKKGRKPVFGHRTGKHGDLLGS